MQDIKDLIRSKSNPARDFEDALKSNAVLLDCLYRLSFTADNLHGNQVDLLVSQLQKRQNEVTVLLGRIIHVKRQALSHSQPEKMESHPVEVVLHSSE